MGKQQMIKAIDTEYNGLYFRSRLEARWAVFFDTAEIRYEYEPEGFEHDGIRYLPDFYLPDFDAYAEVKPDRPGCEKDLLKCARMIYWGGPIKKLIFLGNIPGPCNYGGWNFPCLYYDVSDGVSAGWWNFYNQFDFNPETEELTPSNKTSGCITHPQSKPPFYFADGFQTVVGMSEKYDSKKGRWIYKDVSFRPVSDGELELTHRLKTRNSQEEMNRMEKEENPFLHSAYKLARTARFEFNAKAKGRR